MAFLPWCYCFLYGRRWIFSESISAYYSPDCKSIRQVASDFFQGLLQEHLQTAVEPKGQKDRYGKMKNQR